MKKNLTELVFILDRSGSMAGLEKDTIGGFNSMIARQKAAEGEALVSTVLFSNESKVIHDRIDVRRVEPLTERQYVACGCTALLDAIRPSLAISRNNSWFKQRVYTSFDFALLAAKKLGLVPYGFIIPDRVLILAIFSFFVVHLRSTSGAPC